MRKYILILLTGLSTAWSLDSLSWQQWRAVEDRERLSQALTANPRAVKYIGWEQNWTLDAMDVPFEPGTGARFAGFPFEQRLSLGSGDTLMGGSSWGVLYRLDRMGWDTQDFLMVRTGRGPGFSQTRHGLDLRYASGLSHIRVGVDLGDRLGLWGALGWGAFVAGLSWSDQWNWSACADFEPRMPMGDQRHLGQNYLPNLSVDGVGSHWTRLGVQQNLWLKHLSWSGVWDSSGHSAQTLIWRYDPSRFIEFEAGYAQTQSGWKPGFVARLGAVSVAYRLSREYLDAEPWASHWSVRMDFALEMGPQGDVARTGARATAAPDVVREGNVDKRNRKK